MKKSSYILFSLLIISVINSCSDCPIKQADPIFICESRIVTLEKFNPNFRINGDVVDLEPDYNISIYEFPSSSSSSGSFPNDSRFKDNKLLPVVSIPFAVNDSIFFANIMDTYPTNIDLVGDFLVRDVDLSNNSPTAYIRIYGSIDLIEQNFLTEDSQVFCDYVHNNQTKITNSFSSYNEVNRFGANQAGTSITDYKNFPVIVSNSDGQIIGSVGVPGVNIPPSDVLAKLQFEANKQISFDLLVLPGNIYTYLAKNGKRFVILITEIRQTNIDPFRKRVTMMLYPLDK